MLSQNADGTVSFIHVDPNNPIITLPDGTTAQVQGVATVSETLRNLIIENYNNIFPLSLSLYLSLAVFSCIRAKAAPRFKRYKASRMSMDMRIFLWI